MNYEKFCEGTLGGCALASPMPFSGQKQAVARLQTCNIRYITLQAQNSGLARLFRRALLQYWTRCKTLASGLVSRLTMRGPVYNVARVNVLNHAKQNQLNRIQNTFYIIKYIFNRTYYTKIILNKYKINNIN